MFYLHCSYKKVIEKSNNENLLKVITNTLQNKSWNSESLKKIIITVGKLFNYCAHSWRGFAKSVLPVVLFTVLWFKWSVKKTAWQRLYKEFERDFEMKIIVTIIPINLVTNSLFSLFSFFVETKNILHVITTRIIFLCLCFYTDYTGTDWQSIFWL